MSGGHRTAAQFGFCDLHGKVLYANRKTARRSIRKQKGCKEMREYACDHVAGMFHIGHLADDVRAGRATAREIYGRPA